MLNLFGNEPILRYIACSSKHDVASSCGHESFGEVASRCPSLIEPNVRFFSYAVCPLRSPNQPPSFSFKVPKKIHGYPCAFDERGPIFDHVDFRATNRMVRRSPNIPTLPSAVPSTSGFPGRSRDLSMKFLQSSLGPIHACPRARGKEGWRSDVRIIRFPAYDAVPGHILLRRRRPTGIVALGRLG